MKTLNLFQYILLTFILFIGCEKEGSVGENFRDITSMQSKSELKTDTLKTETRRTYINDNHQYYYINVWQSVDGVNYYCSDTIYAKDTLSVRFNAETE